MRYLNKILTSLILLSLALYSDAQDVIQPDPPVLDLVTVDPATDDVILKWLLSPSPDVEKYVIYAYENSTAHAIDTVRSAAATEYTHTGSLAKYRSITYFMTAIDSSKNISILSNSLSTLFAEAVSDTCQGRIIVSWTSFVNSRHPATSYDVLCSVNGEEFEPLAALPLTQNQYILNGYLSSVTYCFSVRAGNDAEDLSSSNRSCLKSGREKPPEWTEITSVMTANGKTDIAGNYDPSTDINNFLAEIFSPGTGTWQNIVYSSGSGGSVSFNGIASDTGVVNLFRFSPVNNCGRTVTPSLPVRNIVLATSIHDNEIILKWNNPFPAEPAVFSLKRNTGNGYSEVVSGIADTVYTDDYESFAFEVVAGEVTYYVTATRADAPPGTIACRSSVSAVAALEKIYIANSFTPDNNGVNDTFAPVISFTPLAYDLRIYDRGGVLLFHTTNHGIGWDGRNKGTPMPAGAYLYFVKLTSPAGQTIQRKGTVTILP